MCLDTLQLKLYSQRLLCLHSTTGDSSCPEVTKLSLCPSQRCLAKLLETNNSTFLSFVLDCGREYYNAFIAVYWQMVPNADACMGQLVGRCCASLPSADLAGAGHSCPDQHSALRLRMQGLLPKTWHRSLKKEKADVQFLKLFQAPV